MRLENLYFLGNKEVVEAWDDCRRTMEKANGLDLMQRLQVGLKREGHEYAVVKENRAWTEFLRDTLELRWDLRRTSGRGLSKGIQLKADYRGGIFVLYTAESYGWDNVVHSSEYSRLSFQERNEMSLEDKVRLAMTLACPHPDRFYGNPVGNMIQIAIGVFEARIVKKRTI